jgi:CheY-like chemotaxis protein
MTRPLLLLVDDAPEITLIVQRLGKWAGYDLASSADVPSAWEWLSAAPRRPDLLIVDLNLPGLGGLELCRRLRAAPELSRLPVALFGSWDRPDDLAAGVQAGVDFFLPKELLADPDAWRDRLGEILAAADGRLPPGSLSWLEGFALPLSREEWLDAIDQALRHPIVTVWGPDVVRVLVRRAGQRAQPSPAPDEPGEHAAGGADWRLLDDLQLDRRPLARSVSPELLRAFAAALGEEMGRLFGTGVRKPFELALRDALLVRSPPQQ